jgi:hypothetical protein
LEIRVWLIFDVHQLLSLGWEISIFLNCAVQTGDREIGVPGFYPHRLPGTPYHSRIHASIPQPFV